MVVTFDTLKAARRLRHEAGFDEVQANVLASVAEIAQCCLASRADTTQGLAALRRERIGPQDELEALGHQFKDFEARLRAELKAFRAASLRAHGRHDQLPCRFSSRPSSASPPQFCWRTSNPRSASSRRVFARTIGAAGSVRVAANSMRLRRLTGLRQIGRRQLAG